MNLADIQFTPSQNAEIANTDPKLVEAWLKQLTGTPNVKSPAGWLLSAIRTGKYPDDETDVTERLAIQKAEKLIRNHKGNIPSQRELIAEIFSPPELTADLETLERLELETRAHPGREWFGPALEAQLAYTHQHGRLPVPETAGPLHRYDTPANRQRIIALWLSVNPPIDDRPPPWIFDDTEPEPDE